MKSPLDRVLKIKCKPAQGGHCNRCVMTAFPGNHRQGNSRLYPQHEFHLFSALAGRLQLADQLWRLTFSKATEHLKKG